MMSRKHLPLISAVAATVLVLLLAAFIPALFLKSEEVTVEPIPITAAERAELFRLYWAEDPRCTVNSSEKNAFSPSELAGSDETIRVLYEDLRFDMGEPLPESTGEYFYILRDQNGKQLRMREFYEQSSGDWSNWFRIFVDIDTQDVYFLYQSCKCLNRQDYYQSELPGGNAHTLAASWCDIIGADTFAYLHDSGSKANAVYVRDDTAVYYETSYTSYTSPEYVIDFRIVMQSPLGAEVEE